MQENPKFPEKFFEGFSYYAWENWESIKHKQIENKKQEIT